MPAAVEPICVTEHYYSNLDGNYRYHSKQFGNNVYHCTNCQCSDCEVFLYPFKQNNFIAYLIGADIKDDRSWSRCVLSTTAGSTPPTPSAFSIDDCNKWESYVNGQWVDDKIVAGECDSVCITQHHYEKFIGKYSWDHFNEQYNGDVYQCVGCNDGNAYLYPWIHEQAQMSWFIGDNPNDDTDDAFSRYVISSELIPGYQWNVHNTQISKWETYYDGSYRPSPVVIAHCDSDTPSPTVSSESDSDSETWYENILAIIGVIIVICICCCCFGICCVKMMCSNKDQNKNIQPETREQRQPVRVQNVNEDNIVIGNVQAVHIQSPPSYAQTKSEPGNYRYNYNIQPQPQPQPIANIQYHPQPQPMPNIQHQPQPGRQMNQPQYRYNQEIIRNNDDHNNEGKITQQ